MAINLLPKDIQKEQEQGRTQVIANIVSVVFLVLVLASLAIIYSFRAYVTRDYVEVSNNLSDVKQQVNSHQGVEGTLKAIHLKTEKLTEVFGKNYPYGDIFETLDSNRSQGMVFSSISVSKQDSISIKGSVSSLPELSTFMRYVDKTAGTYGKLELTQLNFNEQDFTYVFTLDFLYVPKVEGLGVVSGLN
ncbi:hypothetical protein COY32_00370 [candidate division WWE3 bacterium CG_4_10_14_0_2_um_filter_41_14]|uniref:PilN domain-containing protein n=1 Tax=candidate division WWE3 bacterium CG_4_10_14_0_2_um_filter_41_14 TaxID=1975072 RepID=A0A2M7TLY9_UNCKA|nr:MAG: hypothetical protein COY32_00370 [candidate division WWE3 bacterium CG_4_10_14_0_2_um_filter_41_14]